MLDEKTKDEFGVLVGGECDLATEKASVLIDFIENKNEEDQLELFEILITTFGSIGLRNGVVLTGRKMHNERYIELAQMLDEMIHGTIRLIIHTRKSAKEAAKILRDLIFNLEDQEQRDYCLTEILKDDAVPYHPIPTARLSKFPIEKLKNIVSNNLNEISQLRAIHRAGFDSTVESELTLRILQDVDSWEDKVGLFQTMLIHYKSEVARAYNAGKD